MGLELLAVGENMHVATVRIHFCTRHTILVACHRLKSLSVTEDLACNFDAAVLLAQFNPPGKRIGRNLRRGDPLIGCC